MRALPVEPPAFFRRGPSPLARLAFFGLLSLVLLFADTRFRYLESVRQVAVAAVYPLQRAAQVPRDAAASVADYFTSQHALAEENAALKRRLVAQGPAVQGYARLEQENAQLKALLALRERYDAAAIAVEVLYTGRDPFAQKLYVDKGAGAGIVPGEAVIDAAGVVGQVTRVFPYMAEVTLVSDKDHPVPVKLVRTGMRSVLYGSGAGRAPELRFTAPNADIAVGDVLVTSGLDGTYPPGLAVARVESIERDTGQMFARITAQPLAGVDRSMHLLVLGPAAALPPPPEAPADEAAAAAAKGSRAKSRRGG
jgi:rod shape-determining protein MreC